MKYIYDDVFDSYTLGRFVQECVEAASEAEKQVVTDYGEITMDIADDYLNAKERFDENGRLVTCGAPISAIIYRLNGVFDLPYLVLSNGKVFA